MTMRTPNWLLTLILLGWAPLLFSQQSQPSSQQTQPPSSSSNAPAATTDKTSTAQQKQKNPPSKKDANTPATQPAATTPSAASDNAFPEAQSEAAAKAKNAPPASQNAKTSQHTTSDDNPFPESQSAAAARGAAPDTTSGNQRLKLSPLPGVSSSNANLQAQDLGRKTKRHEKEDEFTRDLNPEGRLEDDLKVASFYMKDWNYKGAYLRYRDALQFDSSNQEALFGLAQASCMQNMTDEATAQFKEYLLQYPTGKRANEAQKALSDPKKCADNR